MTTSILIVDDEPAIRFAVAQFLTQRGYSVECASEAEEAQALISNLDFDVVITDLSLSPIDHAGGLLVISCIRERGLRARIIVMTAHASPAMTAEVHRLGVDFFLRKPVALSDLVAAITSLRKEPKLV
ncbi:MAG TPA: response regulator [Thermoanaerobaculia bacterium]|nr:response regulator [Thermoanaerobaculia bacterium]